MSIWAAVVLAVMPMSFGITSLLLAVVVLSSISFTGLYIGRPGPHAQLVGLARARRNRKAR